MAPFYIILALLLQCSLSYADGRKNETDSLEIEADNEIQSNAKNTESILENTSSLKSEEKNTLENENTIHKSDKDDVLIKDFRTATNDWVDMFLGSSSDLHPSSSVSLMSQATNSNKSPEEQLEDIKEVASEITMAIQSEVASLLTFALNCADKDVEDNKLRKRRSIETPMDSSQLIMKLLEHIKSTNALQNSAIEKMMSAQEIAIKYGVDFSPDPEILSDLAFAANEQAKELTSILEEACDTKNTSCISKMMTTDDNRETNMPEMSIPVINTTYYEFSSDYPCSENISTSHEYTFQPIWDNNHIHYADNHAGYNYYNYDTQISSPPVQYSYGSSVTPKPTFYDSISYNPNDYYAPYCSVDSTSYLPYYSFDEPLDLEPELVGEEYEETVSSKVIIEQDDEPGSATVNHIMTYTLSEKAHYRTPQIEKLPQQMQYYFFLM